MVSLTGTIATVLNGSGGGGGCCCSGAVITIADAVNASKDGASGVRTITGGGGIVNLVAGNAGTFNGDLVIIR